MYKSRCATLVATLLAVTTLAEPDSRFGMNTSKMELADTWSGSGFGWVRFENMKWAMMSPAPGEYRYDGSVKPWHVNMDAILERYHAAGLQVLPYIFMVPDYQSTAGPEVKKNRYAWPPKDPAEYGEAVFQTVARYGSKKHPAEALKTPDKKSGLGLIGAVEIWNEPNLHPYPGAEWGAWAASMNDFWPVFRAGAEGARRADPDIQITSPGFAGIKVEIVDALRSFTYPDGKRPVDFIDVINVHYYSGKVPPEIAKQDPNVERFGQTTTSDRTYVETLIDLVAWRDLYAPGKPIWLTETGYDTAGPHGISEEQAAARLPRCVMLALAHGVEKVFIYREQGSTPSQHAASGLLDNEGSKKPAFHAVQTMIRMLDGVQGRAVRLPVADENVWAFVWKGADGFVLSAWTVNGEATLNLGAGAVDMVAADGAVQQVDRGAIPLAEAPVYIEVDGKWPELGALLKQGMQAEHARVGGYQAMSREKMHLFDFGPAENIGMLVGHGFPRNYTPVTGETAYTPEKGYGIVGGTARQDDRRWHHDTLLRDSVRLHGPVGFQLDLPPGRYRVTLEVSGVNDGDLMLHGDTGGEKTIPFRSRKLEKHAFDLQLTGKPIKLLTDKYVELFYLQVMPLP